MDCYNFQSRQTQPITLPTISPTDIFITTIPCFVLHQQVHLAVKDRPGVLGRSWHINALNIVILAGGKDLENERQLNYYWYIWVYKTFLGGNNYGTSFALFVDVAWFKNSEWSINIQERYNAILTSVVNKQKFRWSPLKICSKIRRKENNV